MAPRAPALPVVAARRSVAPDNVVMLGHVTREPSDGRSVATIISPPQRAQIYGSIQRRSTEACVTNVTSVRCSSLKGTAHDAASSTIGGGGGGSRWRNGGGFCGEFSGDAVGSEAAWRASSTGCSAAVWPGNGAAVPASASSSSCRVKIKRVKLARTTAMPTPKSTQRNEQRERGLTRRRRLEDDAAPDAELDERGKAAC